MVKGLMEEGGGGQPTIFKGKGAFVRFFVSVLCVVFVIAVGVVVIVFVVVVVVVVFRRRRRCRCDRM